jgi:hypothetical protein
MVFFNWFAKNNSQIKNQMDDEDVQRIIDEFNKSSRTIQEQPEVLKKISFDEVISYFKSDIPENANVKKLAIIRQKHPEEQPEGQCLALVFLDETNHLVCLPSGVPSGRKIVAKNLDKKLSKFLGDHDFSLVELKQTSIVVKVIKIASIIIWTLVILLVLLPLLGRLIMTQALAAELNHHPSLEIIENRIAFAGNKPAFEQARQTAYKDAQKYAEKELDKWEAELINRIDTDFLDWYFSYFNQKKQEFDVLFQWAGQNVINGFNQSRVSEEMKNSINDHLQREFARRVVSSKAAESQFKTIVINTTELYLQSLSEKLQNVPIKYKIAQADWQQYLETIKVRLENEQGEQLLPVKIIGGYATTKAVFSLGAMASSQALAAAASQIASMIEPVTAVGLIAWDYWNYHNEVAQNKPRLRKDLVESLHQIKNTLLKDRESGVMSAVNDLDQEIKHSV